MCSSRYTLDPCEKRLPTGGPLNWENYGSTWLIWSAESWEKRSGHSSPDVLIPDPGDGSKEWLAKKILQVMNEQSSPAQ